MQNRTQSFNILAWAVLAGLIFHSCDLYPKFQGWDLIMEIEAPGQAPALSGRLLVPDAVRVAVELRQDGVLKASAEAPIPVPKPGESLKAVVQIPGVVAGKYQVLAYSKNSDGVAVQTARGQIDFKPVTGGSSSVTLRLVPNEGVSGLVTPLAVGQPSLGRTMKRASTGYVKLEVKEALKLWTDAGTAFQLSVQDAQGQALSKNLIANGVDTQPEGTAGSGFYWVYYYFNGLEDRPDFTYYIDTYDSQGKPIDRRLLLEAFNAAELLAEEASDPAKRGPETGKFPADAGVFQAELESLAAAVTEAQKLLPPNYILETVDALGPAEAALTAAAAALEAKRNTDSSVIPVTGVTVTPDPLTVKVGESTVLKAVISPSDATDQGVTWVSKDPLTAEVAADGTVTGMKAGPTEITVTTDDGGFTKTVAVTVTASVIPVTGVTLDFPTLTLAVNGSQVLTAAVLPADASNQGVDWTSNAPDVAEVLADGTVKALKEGSAEIKVTTADGGFTAVCTVTVKNPSLTITLTLTDPEVPVVTATKPDGTPFTGPITVAYDGVLEIKVTGQTVTAWYVDGKVSASLGAGSNLVIDLTAAPLSPGNHSLTYLYTSGGKTYTENLSFTVEAPL